MTSLNIKNDEALRLVKELAELKGESMTTVVLEAAREQLTREQARQSNAGLAETLMPIGRGTAPLWAGPALSVLHGDLLYDEYGLPMCRVCWAIFQRRRYDSA